MLKTRRSRSRFVTTICSLGAWFGFWALAHLGSGDKSHFDHGHSYLWVMQWTSIWAVVGLLGLFTALSILCCLCWICEHIGDWIDSGQFISDKERRDDMVRAAVSGESDA